MDTSRLMKLVGTAIEAGVCDPRLLDRLTDTSSVEAGTVSTEDLVHIYRRRLKRTPTGSQLHSETKALVDFLEQHQHDSLVMMSVSLAGGGGELFLLDRDGEKILHWMRMFSR
ncbi:hypothetical protein ABZ595_01685 [Streptomyces rubradiris]|uniref:hypothetical protein n=1 Tax=Streptomyces rubradiris TaxID=285531 RepID=UPI00340DC55C